MLEKEKEEKAASEKEKEEPEGSWGRARGRQMRKRLGGGSREPSLEPKGRGADARGEAPPKASPKASPKISGVGGVGAMPSLSLPRRCSSTRGSSSSSSTSTVTSTNAGSGRRSPVNVAAAESSGSSLLSKGQRLLVQPNKIDDDPFLRRARTRRKKLSEMLAEEARLATEEAEAESKELQHLQGGGRVEEGKRAVSRDGVVSEGAAAALLKEYSLIESEKQGREAKRRLVTAPLAAARVLQLPLPPQVDSLSNILRFSIETTKGGLSESAELRSGTEARTAKRGKRMVHEQRWLRAANTRLAQQRASQARLYVDTAQDEAEQRESLSAARASEAECAKSRAALVPLNERLDKERSALAAAAAREEMLAQQLDALQVKLEKCASLYPGLASMLAPATAVSEVVVAVEEATPDKQSPPAKTPQSDKASSTASSPEEVEKAPPAAKERAPSPPVVAKEKAPQQEGRLGRLRRSGVSLLNQVKEKTFRSRLSRESVRGLFWQADDDMKASDDEEEEEGDEAEDFEFVARLKSSLSSLLATQSEVRLELEERES